MRPRSRSTLRRITDVAVPVAVALFLVALVLGPPREDPPWTLVGTVAGIVQGAALYEESGEHLLANALLYPTDGAALSTLRRETVDGSSRAAQPRIRRAEAQAPRARPRRRDPAVRAARRRPTRRWRSCGATRSRPRSSVHAVRSTIVLANPEDLEADEHPFARSLLRALQAEGVRLRSAVL